MNKLKEENLRRALSHIERHKQAINTSNNSEDNDFHKLLLQFSYDVYEPSVQGRPIVHTF